MWQYGLLTRQADGWINHFEDPFHLGIREWHGGVEQLIKLIISDGIVVPKLIPSHVKTFKQVAGERMGNVPEPTQIIQPNLSDGVAVKILPYRMSSIFFNIGFTIHGVDSSVADDLVGRPIDNFGVRAVFCNFLGDTY